MAEPIAAEVGGRTLKFTNLDKVLYPLVGFTKAQVIEYYVRIAPALLPHVTGRCMTLRRWPDGVTAEPFYAKRCPDHRPDWLATYGGTGDRGGSIDYCGIDEVAALAWTANLAALELHAPMARADDLDSPTICVFDLDPGEPATITECCQVALWLHELLDTIGLQGFAKTSGSKGMQVYVPLNVLHTHDHASGFAKAAAQLLTKQHPELVLPQMTKKLRAGKVFIDWSQNSRHKTTIAPYSMRGRDRPTVSTPITWDEVSDGADGEPLVFETADVLERVDDVGDLFAPVETLEQQLPG
ncbi:MAG: hypothetical protein HKN26_05515 [Acidimicrobiales bacterium]|nr:hypothetical protein [Acidimicrobiales bacterium]